MDHVEAARVARPFRIHLHLEASDAGPDPLLCLGVPLNQSGKEGYVVGICHVLGLARSRPGLARVRVEDLLTPGCSRCLGGEVLVTDI